MDPNETLRSIAEAETAEEKCKAVIDLFKWLEAGGFQPDWDAYPRSTRVYDALLPGCR